VSDDWQLALAYRTVAEGPEKYTKSMAALRTEVAGGFVWLDFRFPEPSTRVKWADIHFSKEHADRSLLLGITVDDGAETTVNLGSSNSHGLRVESDRPYATLRVRVIAGQISIDGIAPMYEGTVQTILDVYSIPGATAKGWRVVDTAYLRQEDPLDMGYDVVILQSGTNESLDPDFKVALYEAQLNASVMRLKKAYPRARCILIGPPDSQRAAATVRLINDSQQRLASAHSCSHWNWQKAMGGPGAASRWQAKGWMQADLLHLTPPGYEQSARSLASSVPIKRR
jgi:lysophospholipase L1-like esterase